MYDPYGGQLPEQQMNNSISIGDVATYGIKPSSYVQMAMVYPGMWSPNKGINVPFKRLAKDISHQFNSAVRLRNNPELAKRYTARFGKPDKLKSVSSLVSRGVKGSFLLGMNEAGYVGGDWLNKKETPIYKRRVNRRDFKIALGEAKKEYFNSYDPKGLNKIKWKLFGRLQAGSRVKDEVGAHVITKMGYSTAQKFARFGLGAAKAGSIVGAGMLAWDLASIVAAPLAQAGMNIINSAANTFQSRYMPEMGGQLQLSYLSQGAATERQKAVQAISKSYINGRSAFGSEGALFHDR